MNPSTGVFHFNSSMNKIQLVEFLKSKNFTQDHIGEWLKLGSIYVNHQRCHQDTQLQSGDYIRVHSRPKRFKVDLPLEVVDSNSEFVVVHKPPGLPSIPTVDNALENALALAGENLLPTHRIDTQTEGLLLLAKTKETQKQINKLFQVRKIKKIYRCLVETNIPPGKHLHYMSDAEHTPKQLSQQRDAKFPKECLIDIIECHKMSDHLYDLKVQLLTGRTHQIRAQLSFLGAAIVGDIRYGGIKSHLKGIALCSSEIQFSLCGNTYNFITEPQWTSVTKEHV
jgi:23S rRNA pseudouridine1911/1915/1917 synthase